MGFSEDFLRLFHNPYIAGAQAHAQTTGSTVLLVEARKFDQLAITLSGSEGSDARYNEIARQTALQLNEKIPGISEYLSSTQLYVMGSNALEDRTSALNNVSQYGIAVMTYSAGSEESKEQFATGMSGGGFNPSYFRTLPGSEADYQAWTGAHEAEHSNQMPTEFSVNASTRIQQTLGKEVLSDMAGLNILRAQGKDDVVQAIIDTRILGAANGSTATHATSIFLDDPAFEGVTPEHVSAAMSFKNVMLNIVQNEAGLTRDSAETLRIQYPHEFAALIQQRIDRDGGFPTSLDKTWPDTKQLVADRMGVSLSEFDRLGPESAAEIAAAWGELREEGKLSVPVTNPYVSEYITQYLGATERMFVPDAAPETAPTFHYVYEPGYDDFSDYVAPPSSSVPDLSESEKEYATAVVEKLTFHLAAKEYLEATGEELPQEDWYNHLLANPKGGDVLAKVGEALNKISEDLGDNIGLLPQYMQDNFPDLDISDIPLPVVPDVQPGGYEISWQEDFERLIGGNPDAVNTDSLDVIDGQGLTTLNPDETVIGDFEFGVIPFEFGDDLLTGGISFSPVLIDVGFGLTGIFNPASLGFNSFDAGFNFDPGSDNAIGNDQDNDNTNTFTFPFGIGGP
jgi:hypothetical protein